MTRRGARAFMIGAAVCSLSGGQHRRRRGGRICLLPPGCGHAHAVSTGTPEQVRRVVECGGTMYAVGTFTEISRDGTGYARDNAFSFSDTAPSGSRGGIRTSTAR